MKDKNIVELQIDLVNELWTRGWAGFKGDAIGIEESLKGIVLGIKGGRIIVLKIARLEGGNSKKNVGNLSSRLNQIENIAQPPGMMESVDVTVGFAISRGWSDIWQFLDADRVTIKYDDEMKPLRQVLEE